MLFGDVYETNDWFHFILDSSRHADHAFDSQYINWTYSYRNIDGNRL